MLSLWYYLPSQMTSKHNVIHYLVQLGISVMADHVGILSFSLSVQDVAATDGLTVWFPSQVFVYVYGTLCMFHEYGDLNSSSSQDSVLLTYGNKEHSNSYITSLEAVTSK